MIKYHQAHYIRNKEKYREKNRRWRLQNKERMKELVSRWEQANREKRNAYRRDRYAKNGKIHRLKERPIKMLSLKIKRALKKELNKESIKEHRRLLSREYRKNNPSKTLAASRLKKARKKAALIGDKKEIEKFYKLIRTGNRLKCFYCQRVVCKKDRHVDHKVALAKGGSHSVDNLCCSCAKCNMEKHTRSANEFSRQLIIF